MMEQVVRWINDQEVPFGRAVPLSTMGTRSALIAETAFRRAAVGASLFPADDDAERASAAMISLLPRGQFGDAVLSPGEQLEVGLIQRNLMRYAEVLGNPEYFPKIPGCGVVNNSIGDIYSFAHLVEVKTVSRPFRSTDLRQLLTYSAMMRASGIAVEKLSLYNPRRAYRFTADLDEISLSLCGRSSVELMEDLIDTMIGFQVSA
ncbi:hypothetical protein ACTOB_001176 [Actinoplanes oblitus]|uniref:Uncharacterized protein n=1 Tax=Actinoplanes oblitus TaxID=3040509 RepID=A0ABY8WPC8_9ACTN|nr:hypothetical protein [Actinoplanes oblitus]WIM97635.1 hypothetical protein ACTOB_001176 [Actinoplanes oblitus]